MLATCHLLVYPCSTAGIIHVMLRLVIMHYIQYRRHRIFTCNCELKIRADDEPVRVCRVEGGVTIVCARQLA